MFSASLAHDDDSARFAHVSGVTPWRSERQGDAPQQAETAPCHRPLGASSQRSEDAALWRRPHDGYERFAQDDGSASLTHTEAPAPLSDAPMPLEPLGASPQQSGDAPWHLVHPCNADGVDGAFDPPGLQMVQEALAQEATLASLEPELETHLTDPDACAPVQEGVDTVPSLRTEGTGLDDGVLHLALAARALRRVWGRLRPCDLDYYDLSGVSRSAQSLARSLGNKHRTTTSKRWKAWVSKSIQDGGRKILQWVKRPEIYGPSMKPRAHSWSEFSGNGARSGRGMPPLVPLSTMGAGSHLSRLIRFGGRVSRSKRQRLLALRG